MLRLKDLDSKLRLRFNILGNHFPFYLKIKDLFLRAYVRCVKSLKAFEKSSTTTTGLRGNKPSGRDAHEEIFPKSYLIKLKSDCICHFPIDFKPNGCPFGSKSIRKW